MGAPGARVKMKGLSSKYFFSIPASACLNSHSGWAGQGSTAEHSL